MIFIPRKMTSRALDYERVLCSKT